MKLATVLLAAASTVFLFQAGAEVERPEVGKPAPTFTLNDNTGAKHTVGGKSEQWTVVAFYPKAMTPG